MEKLWSPWRSKYIESFKNLCESGYIEKVSARIFRLTYSGKKIAKELAEEELKANPPQDEAD